MRYLFDCIIIFLLLLAIAVIIYISTGCQKIVVITNAEEVTIEDEVGVDNELPLRIRR